MLDIWEIQLVLEYVHLVVVLAVLQLVLVAVLVHVVKDAEEHVVMIVGAVAQLPVQEVVMVVQEVVVVVLVVVFRFAQMKDVLQLVKVAVDQTVLVVVDQTVLVVKVIALVLVIKHVKVNVH